LGFLLICGCTLPFTHQGKLSTHMRFPKIANLSYLQTPCELVNIVFTPGSAWLEQVGKLMLLKNIHHLSLCPSSESLSMQKVPTYILCSAKAPNYSCRKTKDLKGPIDGFPQTLG
jgi:hypothetical protein